jgi:hypothetical protein
MAVARWGDFAFGTRRWSQGGGPVGGAATYEDFFDGPNWRRVYEVETDPTDSSGPYVEVPPEGDPLGPEERVCLSSSASKTFTFEIRDGDGDLVQEISDILSATLTEELDAASILEFTLYGDNGAVANLTSANEVWLRDRYGIRVDTFRISQTRKWRNEAAYFFSFEGVSSVQQLGREWVESFNSESGDTARDIIEALLENQEQTPIIEVGDIDKTVGDEEIIFSVSQMTVLEALIELQRTLTTEGHFFVSANHKLCWSAIVGSRGETFSVGEQIRGLDVQYDWSSNMVTRLYLYGMGATSESRVRLSDHGDYSVDYMERNIALYGIVPYRKIDNRIKKPETLANMAQRILKRYAGPSLTVSVEALELSKADEDTETDTRWLKSFEDVFIGSVYRIVDAAAAVDTEVEIVKIQRDLSKVLPISVELNSRRESLSNYFDRILSQLNPEMDVMDDRSRYPHVGRIFDSTDDYSGYSDLEYKKGDWRHTPDGMEYWEDGWHDVTDKDREGSLRINPDTGELERYDGTEWTTTDGDGNPLTESVAADLAFGEDFDIQSVGDANAAGETGLVADAGHVHALWHIGYVYEDLPDLSSSGYGSSGYGSSGYGSDFVPAVGYTESDGRYWAWDVTEAGWVEWIFMSKVFKLEDGILYANLDHPSGEDWVMLSHLLGLDT